MRTCISPEGTFKFGIHKPSYIVKNFRTHTNSQILGIDQNQDIVENHINFPHGDVDVAEADWIYEIANPFSFQGTTFISKAWADRSADNYNLIRLDSRPEVSLSRLLVSEKIDRAIISRLPRPLLLSLATCSTDPEDLVELAHLSCIFAKKRSDGSIGLQYRSDHEGTIKAETRDHALFEAVANNPALPDSYKIAMVIRPGAQGASEIVGDYRKDSSTHSYEYLRRNSYIGGGHYAANMADDTIRYDIDTLTYDDMAGLRHLYYQRSYTRIAAELGINHGEQALTPEELEHLRDTINNMLEDDTIDLTATLWGWNFGFDYAPTDYRLHASHQQIHQQYALIPRSIECFRDGFSASTGTYVPFSSGDMIAEIIDTYKTCYGHGFFEDYLTAIENNLRMDGRPDKASSLVVWQDERVILFVPKAQTSQWELQIMTKPGKMGTWPGNVLETDTSTRRSIDSALLKAQKALAGRGARMVTSIEYSKRFTSPRRDQPLLYCLLPKLPESPGAFSENQHRFINGHYPEDFAAVCRGVLS